MTSEKAEHVTGIVLQPLWKIQKVDWTVRKNVFETDPSKRLVDEQTFRGRHPSQGLADEHGLYRGKQPYSYFRNDNNKESSYILHKEYTDRNRDRPSNPPRFRQPYSRKRWTNEVTRKPSTSTAPTPPSTPTSSRGRSTTYIDHAPTRPQWS